MADETRHDRAGDGETRHSRVRRDRVVELTRVPPIAAEIVVARLRAYGIPAVLGAESVYPSLSVTEGVPVFVPMEDASRAGALLEDDEPNEQSP